MICNIIINMPLKPGKVAPELLEQILKKLKCESPHLLVGPAYGVDGAIISINDKMVAVSSDPITFTSVDNVYYLFACNINDLISMGARPEFFGINVLFHEGVTEEDVIRTFDEISRFSKAFQLCVITGHTEVTPGLKDTILSGFIMGRVVREVSPLKVKPGHFICQIKGVAIEGTCIIAREKFQELLDNFGFDFASNCKNFLVNPGICLYDVGLRLITEYDVKNLHDPTEGGILTALYEALVAAGLGGIIHSDRIIVYEETRKLCEYYRIDPLGLISSGSIIAFAEPEEAERICREFEKEGIPARIIGEVTSRDSGIILEEGGRRRKLTPFSRDQILEVLE